MKKNSSPQGRRPKRISFAADAEINRRVASLASKAEMRTLESMRMENPAYREKKAIDGMINIALSTLKLSGRPDAGRRVITVRNFVLSELKRQGIKDPKARMVTAERLVSDALSGNKMM